MKTKRIQIVDDRQTEKHIIGADILMAFFVKCGEKGKIEFYLIFDNFRNYVITSFIDMNFLYFYNQYKCMIIDFNLIYNLNLPWLKHNFSRGHKLLHVF